MRMRDFHTENKVNIIKLYMNEWVRLALLREDSNGRKGKGDLMKPTFVLIPFSCIYFYEINCFNIKQSSIINNKRHIHTYMTDRKYMVDEIFKS